MSPPTRWARGSLLPLGVFGGTFGLHFLWLGLFPAETPGQGPWAALPSEGAADWLATYLEAQSYWLGYSYALSLTFAAVAIRRYLKSRSCGAVRFAAGGLTFTGVLSVAGCYLIGCCGSPMLVVWMNLFGAKFLPFAKPLLAAVTTLSVAGAWLWMAWSTSPPVRLTVAPAGRSTEGQRKR